MDAHVRAWVASVTGAAEVRAIRSLSFGVGSRVELIAVDELQLVLRTYEPRGLIEVMPSVVTNEVTALTAAGRVLGAPVPELIASDPSGDSAGCPAILMTLRRGAPVVRDVDVERLAAPIAQLHASALPRGLGPVWRWRDPARATPPAWTREPEAWAQLAELLRSPQPAAPSVFLHRDYHPGNVLWTGGDITGIVDWATSGIGPRGIDVAHTRANLALIDSVEAADAFLVAYVALVPGYRHDVWWDAADLFGFTDFSGVLACNAFGAELDIETLHDRADDYAASLAELNRSSRPA
jgi:aminoglycoside phosphotransferase (APT) family kinase protein